MKLNGISSKVKDLYDKFFEIESDIETALIFVAQQKRCNEISINDIKQLILMMKSQQFNFITAKLLNMLAYFLLDEGKSQVAIELWDEAIQIFEELEDETGMVQSNSGLMCGYFNLGLYDESIEFGVRGLRLAQESGDDQLLLLALGNIAFNYYALEKYEDAKEALHLIRCLKEPAVEGNKVSLDQLEAGIYLADNNLKQAKYWIDRAYGRVFKMNHPALLSETLRMRGKVYYQLGDYQVYEESFKESIRLAKEGDFLEYLAQTYYEWGKIELANDNNLRGEMFLLEAYGYSKNLGSPLIYVNVCKVLIELYKSLENFELALYYYELCSEAEKEAQLKRSELWEKRINREKSISEAKIFKSLYDELENISHIGRSFTEKLCFEKLIIKVHEEISKMMDTTVLAITEVNEKENCLDYLIYLESGHRLNSGYVSLDDKNNLGVYCIKQKENLIINNLDEEYEWYHLKKDEALLFQKGIKSMLYCPLIIHNKVKGYITVQSYQRNSYTQRDLTKLSVLASYIVIALENAKLYCETDYLARYDGLTSLYNRVEVLKKGEKLYNRAQYKNSMSVLMIDIDHFKLINDTYGHQMGDQVIQFFSDLLKTKRNRDTVIGRYGGEEFIIFLNHRNLHQAYEFAEQLREELRELSFKLIDLSTGINEVTASFGVYEYRFDEDSLDDGIYAADQAMYQSKINGRDQVTIYSDLLLEKQVR